MNSNLLLNISKIIATIIIASIFFSGSIRSIKSLKIIRLISKSKKILVVYSKYNIAVLLLIVIGFIFISYIFKMQTLVGKLMYLVLGIIILIEPIRVLLESTKSGVYDNGIIYSNYSTEWSNIEKYQEVENGIRLIHKEKGAFDIGINQAKKKEIIFMLKSIGIPEI
jgi:hypothetical protein